MGFSSKLDWGNYIISIVKSSSNKIGALDVLYLYKSAIWLCMEYCFHIWAGAKNGYEGLLVVHLLPLLSSRPMVEISLFYRCYFTKCFSEVAELVPLPHSRGRSIRYFDRLHNFTVTIPRCCKDILSTVFFLAQLDSRILYL